jgi:hypothetical protein
MQVGIDGSHRSAGTGQGNLGSVIVEPNIPADGHRKDDEDPIVRTSFFLDMISHPGLWNEKDGG